LVGTANISLVGMEKEILTHDKKKSWPAIENSCKVLTKLFTNLTFNTDFEYHDVLGFDEGLYEMIPPNRYGVLFCFELTDKNDFKRNLDDTFLNTTNFEKNLFFLKQTIGNSCATLSQLYLIANSDIKTSDSSPGGDLISLAKEKKLEMSDLIEEFETNKDLEEAHIYSFQKKKPPKEIGNNKHNVTDTGKKKKKKKKKKPLTNGHFVSFGTHNGCLIEYDSRKDGPVNHGPIKTHFLADCGVVIQKFMQLTPDLTTFSVSCLIMK
jgi:hypothetical protein